MTIHPCTGVAIPQRKYLGVALFREFKKAAPEYGYIYNFKCYMTLHSIKLKHLFSWDQDIHFFAFAENLLFSISFIT